MGCCNGGLSAKKAVHGGHSQGAEFVVDFQDISPGSPTTIETNGHGGGEFFNIYDGSSTSEITASWVSTMSAAPGIANMRPGLEAVHEEESVINTGEADVRPMLQRVPSGDSFHTCISHESVLVRFLNVTQNTGALPEKNDDENVSTTSTQIRSLPHLSSSRQPTLQAKSVSSPLPLGDGVSSPLPLPGADGLGSGSTVIRHPSVHSGAGNSHRLAGMRSDDAGGRRSIGRRLSHLNSQIRHSIRRGQSDPTADHHHHKRSSKRTSQNGLTHNGHAAAGKKGKGNPNMPREYVWLTELLVMICDNQAGGAGSLDRNNKDASRATPLFVVLGACPSTWAGMQAVLYSAIGEGVVDFWWTKPRKNSPEMLERLTLDRWAKGPYKNDPGRSKGIYKPLADLFANANKKDDQLFKFGLEPVGTGGSCVRAFIEDPRTAPPGRYYLYLVWQEEWTQNPLASNKFIKGKIAYQREPERGIAGSFFFLREYCITNGKLHLSEVEEQASEVLPGATLKELGTLKLPGS